MSCLPLFARQWAVSFFCHQEVSAGCFLSRPYTEFIVQYVLWFALNLFTGGKLPGKFKKADPSPEANLSKNKLAAGQSVTVASQSRQDLWNPGQKLFWPALIQLKHLLCSAGALCPHQQHQWQEKYKLHLARRCLTYLKVSYGTLPPPPQKPNSSQEP